MPATRSQSPVAIRPGWSRILLLGATVLGVAGGSYQARAATRPITAQPAPPADRGPVLSAEREAHLQELVVDRKGPQPGVAVASAACVGGTAAGYPCRDVDLESFLPVASIGGGSGNDVWGWTDPVTGKEYALYGRSNGTSLVDISNPASPIYVGNLPTHTSSSIWRDIKVYQNFAFVVSEAGGHGLQVFDLTRLRGVTGPPRTFTEDGFYGRFGNAHNLVINEETGFAYAVGTDTCSGGLHMIDIRNPRSPQFAGCFAGDGYTHDAQCVVYRGPDATYAGREICFCANEDTLTIVDVTNKSAPAQISRTGYSGRDYTHQGWLTEDQAYFLLDDEGDETNFGVNTTTHIWNLRSLAAPVRFSTFVSGVAAIDHNVYVLGRRAYQANYHAGLRILDIACIAGGSLTEVGYFDIYPADDSPRFDGAWSNFPYYASGVVAVSGIDEGLFIVRPHVASPAPVAIPSPAAVACGGGTVTLDGSGSTRCSAAGLRYRWLDGAAVVCPWSTSPVCDVTPSATRTYTLEVECPDRVGCIDRASVTVTVGTRPVAVAGPDVALCAGASTILDGAGSRSCPIGRFVYRWLAGATVVCPWSTSPLCPVTPAATTVYTLEASCDAAGICPSSDTLTVTVDPNLRPGNLGNSLRAVKATSDVVLTWGSDALARTYSLYRSIDRRTWPASAYRSGLPLTARTEPDVPGPPNLYTYRAAGASCSGVEGP